MNITEPTTTANHADNSNNNNMSDEQKVQHQVQQHQLQLHRQNSAKFSNHITHKKNDLESKINRMYSKILVKYHWAFLLLGLFVTLVLTGVGFIKQPLPDFLDPKRGFGARGEGTLTSQLIVLKNINKDIMQYQKDVLNLYEKIKSQPAKRKEIIDELVPNEQVVDDDGGGVEEEETQDFTTTPEIRHKALMNRLSNETEEMLKVVEDPWPFEGDSQPPPQSPENHPIISADLLETQVYKALSGQAILDLIPLNLTVPLNQIHTLNSIEKCHYSLGLEENLELYFSASENMKKPAKKAKKNFSSEFEKNTFDNDDDDDPSNLLNLNKLKSLCAWDERILSLLVNMSHPTPTPCYFSLPKSIALLNNKTDCMSLTNNDVNHFLHIVQQCSSLQKSGVLLGAADQSKQKPEIYKLLDKTDPFIKFMNEEQIKNNMCFKKNLLHIIYEHLIDNQFLSTQNNRLNYDIKVSSLFIINEIENNTGGRFYDGKFMYDFYLKYFHKTRYDDKVTELVGINLMGVRQDAAMRLLSQEMVLVALAISLIVIVTLLYLKSVVISMIVNVGVAMSVGVSFFAYRIVFNIDLFPFINMMAAFLLIGIACDDVYVLFDAWYNEKAKIIMEDLPVMIEKQSEPGSLINSSESAVNKSDDFLLPPMFVERKLINNSNKANKSKEGAFLNSPLGVELLESGITLDQINRFELNPAYVRLAPLKDEQMIRVMGGTLRHAASSIFVTSFTTAAAFLTNYITKLPYVQLFGVFTGTCILVYFCMVITMVAAFVISYEKHIQLWRCKLRPTLSTAIERWFDKLMDKVSLINYRVVNQHLPNILIKFRFVWFTLFLAFGIAGMIAVFYKPQLKPPTNWRYQFFQNDNLFESFEFNIKDRFWSYVNEEKRNLTEPEIFFVFGIHGKDTGSKFNPDDDGYLLHDSSFDFFEPETQIWFHDFINNNIANRTDLFMSELIVDEWNTYLKQIQMFCHRTLKPMDLNKSEDEIKLPYESESLLECMKDIQAMLSDSDVETFESLMASFPRRIIFLSSEKRTRGVLLRVNANRTFSDYDTVSDYYHSVKNFHQDALKTAPKGLETGWFISVGFALYDLQYQLINGTYSSLVASMAIALIILLLTSGNFIISIFAIITISFSIADTIAIFVFLGWNLSILESVVIIMSVGLSVDFSCHYGVAYINSDVSKYHLETLNENDEEESENKLVCGILTPESKSSCKLRKLWRTCLLRYKKNDQERFFRIRDIFNRVGSAVLMAAFTTFLAGTSMCPSNLTSFSKMGQFLMLVMCTSYLFATFFFVPLCAIFGPTKNFGDIPIKVCFQRIFCRVKKRRSKESLDEVKKLEKLIQSVDCGESPAVQATSIPKTTTSI